MLIYANTNPLASGDFSHVVTVGMVQEQLAMFPADWLVSGVGATDWEHNVGEVLPRGTAGDSPFWLADAGSFSQADGDPLWSSAVHVLKRANAILNTLYKPLLFLDPADAALLAWPDRPGEGSG
jgi:hypothetical protein